MIELCAAEIYPNPKIYLGFTMCLTRDYRDIPDRDLVEDCALEHGIDFSKLNACVSSVDGYGLSLLRKSVERTSAAGVTLSCTVSRPCPDVPPTADQDPLQVRLEDEVRCIRDGGKWKNCEDGHKVDDLVRDVERLYNNL